MNIIPTDILPAVLVKSEERRPVCGVRPSDLAASPNSAAPSSAELSLQGRIEDIFDTGADVWVSLNLGSALLKARWTADTAPALGQSVTATVGVEKLHLFDANSGLRRCA
jgi:ABC-type sugar transport system ATPase subunit